MRFYQIQVNFRNQLPTFSTKTGNDIKMLITRFIT